MDRYDKNIIALLIEDARQSVSDISRKVNLSRSAVTERIKRLEEKGIINGYHASVLMDATSSVAAYFSLTFRPIQRDLIEPLVKALPEIRSAHFISGDLDLILLVEAENMARLTAIRVEMDSWPYIEKVTTHLCLCPAK